MLSEETRVPDGTLGDEAGVLLAHGEALAEAGDPQGAADSLRRAVARAPDGQTAADAALALFRLATVAATSPGGSGAAALPEALEALAGAMATIPRSPRRRCARQRSAPWRPDPRPPWERQCERIPAIRLPHRPS